MLRDERYRQNQTKIKDFKSLILLSLPIGRDFFCPFQNKIKTKKI